MSIGEITVLIRGGIREVLMLTSPVLGAALIIGLVIAIFQATTSIQEQTLTFIPKIVGVFAALILFGPWMLTKLTEYITTLWMDFSIYLG